MVDQTRARLVMSSVLSPLLSLSIVTLTLFTLKDANSSRVFIFTFGGLSIFGFLTYRLALWTYQHRQLAAGAYAKNVVLVGQPSAVSWMAEHFRANAPANRFRLAGWLNVPRPPAPGTTGDELDLPCLAPVDGLGDILIHRPLHEVIAIQSAGETDWLPQVIEDCDYFRVRLRIVPEALLTGTLRDLQLVFRSEPLRLPEVVLEPPHQGSEALFLKRVIDHRGFGDPPGCPFTAAASHRNRHQAHDAAPPSVVSVARHRPQRPPVHRLQVHHDGRGRR